jgi:hypothetical protein
LVLSHRSRACQVALLLALAINDHGELLVWCLLDTEQVFKLCGTYSWQHLGTPEWKVSFGQLLTDRDEEEGMIVVVDGAGDDEVIMDLSIEKNLEIGCLRS